MINNVYDVPTRDPFTPKQRAMYDLWEAIWKQAHRLLADESPSVLNKIEIVHEMTVPEHRRDPIVGAERLERYIEAHSGNSAYEKYLGPVVSALVKYGAATGRHREPAGVAD